MRWNSSDKEAVGTEEEERRISIGDVTFQAVIMRRDGQNRRQSVKRRPYKI